MKIASDLRIQNNDLLFDTIRTFFSFSFYKKIRNFTGIKNIVRHYTMFCIFYENNRIFLTHCINQLAFRDNIKSYAMIQSFLPYYPLHCVNLNVSYNIKV